MKDTEVNLSNLAGGALHEMFQAEWEKVLSNIMDPSTSATTKREINIKVVCFPTEDRTHMDVTLTANAKVAQSKPAGAIVFLARRAGNRTVAVEHDPKQMEIEPEEERKGLRALPGGGGAALG